MSDDWLDQLQQLHDADKAKHQAKADTEKQQQKQEKAKQQQAVNLLRKSQAHELMRQIQKVLLGGGGTLRISKQTKKFERAITLSWQGPISAAKRPILKDQAEHYSILIGVHQGELWVNDKRVSAATSEALKSALLDACKNPKRIKHVNDK